jgi:REP element-mobilizing transposase RayT
MARRPRLEVEGGLYHLIARGNNRQAIFHSDDDFKKFLSLLTIQKAKLGFYLYAYCLMTNHFHLLVERQTEYRGSDTGVRSGVRSDTGVRLAILQFVRFLIQLI